MAGVTLVIHGKNLSKQALEDLRTDVKKTADAFNEAGNAQVTVTEKGKNLKTQLSGLAIATGAVSAALGLATRGFLQQSINFEKMMKGLNVVAGSTENANKQFDRLRQVAKLPGLGFEEAIQGSIRLQSVGISAKDSERALMAFGNALAVVGKGRFELEHVIYNLVQMSSQGKITARDIRDISLFLPQLRTAMQNAFGTSNTELIQDMGISVDTFREKLVEALEKVPTVAGSAANSIENLGDSLKLAKKTIGDVLLPTFRSVLDYISNMVEGIQDLSQTNKQLIAWGTAGGFAITSIATSLLGLGIAIPKISAGIGILGTALSWLATNPIVAAIAALGILATTIYLVYRRQQSLRLDIDRLRRSFDDARSSIQKMSDAQELIDELKRLGNQAELSADQEKRLKEIKDQLIAISPSFIDILTNENKALRDQANEAQNALDKLKGMTNERRQLEIVNQQKAVRGYDEEIKKNETIAKQQRERIARLKELSNQEISPIGISVMAQGGVGVNKEDIEAEQLGLKKTLDTLIDLNNQRKESLDMIKQLQDWGKTPPSATKEPEIQKPAPMETKGELETIKEIAKLRAATQKTEHERKMADIRAEADIEIQSLMATIKAGESAGQDVSKTRERIALIQKDRDIKLNEEMRRYEKERFNMWSEDQKNKLALINNVYLREREEIKLNARMDIFELDQRLAANEISEKEYASMLEGIDAKRLQSQKELVKKVKDENKRQADASFAAWSDNERKRISLIDNQFERERELASLNYQMESRELKKSLDDRKATAQERLKSNELLLANYKKTLTDINKSEKEDANDRKNFIDRINLDILNSRIEAGQVDLETAKEMIAEKYQLEIDGLERTKDRRGITQAEIDAIDTQIWDKRNQMLKEWESLDKAAESAYYERLKKRQEALDKQSEDELEIERIKAAQARMDFDNRMTLQQALATTIGNRYDKERVLENINYQIARRNIEDELNASDTAYSRQIQLRTQLILLDAQHAEQLKDLTKEQYSFLKSYADQAAEIPFQLVNTIYQEITAGKDVKDQYKQIDEDRRRQLKELAADTKKTANERQREIEKIEKESAARRAKIEEDLNKKRGDIIKSFFTGILKNMISQMESDLQKSISNSIMNNLLGMVSNVMGESGGGGGGGGSIFGLLAKIGLRVGAGFLTGGASEATGIGTAITGISTAMTGAEAASAGIDIISQLGFDNPHNDALARTYGHSAAYMSGLGYDDPYNDLRANLTGSLIASRSLGHRSAKDLLDQFTAGFNDSAARLPMSNNIDLGGLLSDIKDAVGNPKFVLNIDGRELNYRLDQIKDRKTHRNSVK